MFPRNALALLTAFLTASACQGDDLRAEFVATCSASQEGFTDELCECAYDGLHEEFSDEQMTRISGLFTGNVPEAMENLAATGSASDVSILERFDLVEGTLEGCFAG